MGFPLRLLADDEKLVLVLRRHVKVLFTPFMIFLGVAVLIGLSFLIPGQPWPQLVVGVLGLIVLLRWSFWPLVVWLNTSYAITTRRLIIRTGVFNRSGHDMPLSRLNDVSFSHNLIERMFGCGTLVVESAGEQGQLKLDDIPKVELVQHTLHRLADDLRGVRGDDAVDADLARTLDDAFEDEYRGPVGGGDHAPDERRT